MSETPSLGAEAFAPASTSAPGTSAPGTSAPGNSVPGTSAPGTSARRLYRIAGWGGIGAFVAWAGQPALVAVFSATDDSDLPDWQAFAGDRSWVGAVETLVFCGIGVGLLFLVLATNALIRRAGRGTSVASQVGLVMGVLGAAMWVLFGGSTMAEFTSVGAALPDAAPDGAAQTGLIHVLNIVSTGYGVSFALFTAGWAVMLMTVARRAGVIGVPLTIVVGVFLLGFLEPFLVPFSAPWGMIGFVVQALVLGIAFLVKSRKA